MKNKNLGCIGWVLVLVVVGLMLKLIVCIFSSFWSILGLILMIASYVWMRQEAKTAPGKSRTKQLVLFLVGLALVLVFSLMCMFGDQQDKSAAPSSSVTQTTAEPKSNSAPQPESKPASETDAKAVSVPDSKPAEPAAQPESKPASESKPATQPESKPASESKPATQPESKPASESKPATQPESKPASESKPAAPPAPQSAPEPAPSQNVTYSNCSEVRAAGKAPLYKGDPGYAPKLDRDHDGIACE